MHRALSLRNLLGLLFLILFLRSASGFFGGGQEGMLGGFGAAIIAMVWLILAAICFSGTLSEWFAAPLHRLVDAVYFGSNPVEAPPVTLKLARAYRQERRYPDAIAECERQLEYHPREPELWSELLRSARACGDEALLDHWIAKARRRLPEDVRRTMEREFPGLQS